MNIMNKLEGQEGSKDTNNDENMEQNVSNVNETETPEDQQIEKDLDQEPTNVDDMLEPEDETSPAEGEPSPGPSEEEMDAAEEEMEEAKFNSEEYVKEVDKGFSEFKDKILSKLNLDKEGREKLAEAAQKFVSELYDDFKHVMKEVDDLYSQGKDAEAAQKGITFTEAAKEKASEYFGDKVDGWLKENDSLFEEAKNEKDPAKKEKMVKIAMEAVDFIPFVGDVKMIVEGAVGRTAQGKKLDGVRRFMHSTQGVVFLALNAVSYGGGGTIAKGVKGAKVFTRSAALLRKMGLSRKVYKPVYKAGVFLAKHPNVAKVVDKGLDHIRDRRKIMASKVGTKVNTAFNDMASGEQERKEAA